MNMIRTLFAGVVSSVLLSGIAIAEPLRIGVAVEPSSIHPHFHNAQQDLQIARHIFDFLVTRDHRQQLSPGLAVSWEAVNETTWEFKLREGVTWHDGSPFTADDVIFTFEQVPNVPGSPGGYGAFVLGKTVTKIDDHTIRVTTERPHPLMPNDLATFAILSREHGEGALPDDYNSGEAAVGTGPYKFVEWMPGDRLILEANENYWGDKPIWSRVTFQPISSDPSRIAALLSGQVDVIDHVPPTDIAQLKRNADVVVDEAASNRLIYFSPDSNRHITPHVKANDGSELWPNPLQDGRVRKAISMAINRQAIVDRVMDGSAYAAGQVVPEGFFGHNPSLEVERYDPEAARSLLAEAGYPDGFRLTVHGTRDRYINDASVVEAIAQMLAQIGLKTEVVVLPASVYFTRASNLEFSFALFAYGSETGEASAPLNGFLHTYNPQTGAGAFNRARYSNVLFDTKLQEAMNTVDDVRREQLLRDATAIAVTDYAFIPSHFQVNVWALRKGLRYEARTDENTLAQSVVKAE